MNEDKKYLVVSEVDGEVKYDVVESDSPYGAMTNVSFFGEYDVKKQEIATTDVYELGENLLIEMTKRASGN